MNIGRQLVMFAALVVLLSGVGCEKKKPQLPKQAKAPVEAIPEPLPVEITVEAPPPAPVPQQETEAKAEESKPQPPKRRRPRKPPQNPPAQSTAANPPASPPPANNTLAMAHPPANPAAEAPPDTAIAANVSSAQLTQQKQTTAQLIDSTEKTLSGLSHLSHDQEEMVAQIRSYVAQSRKATTEGDFERAFNLATKAHLLSDALLKQ